MKFINRIVSKYKTMYQNLDWYHEACDRLVYWDGQYDLLDYRTDERLVQFVDGMVDHWRTELSETLEALDESLF